MTMFTTLNNKGTYHLVTRMQKVYPIERRYRQNRHPIKKKKEKKKLKKHTLLGFHIHIAHIRE